MREIEIKMADAERAVNYARKRFALDPKIKRAECMMQNLRGQNIKIIIFR